MNATGTMTAEHSITAQAASVLTDLGLGNGALTISGQDGCGEPKVLSLTNSSEFSRATGWYSIQHDGLRPGRTMDTERTKRNAVRQLSSLPTKAMITIATTSIRTTDLHITDCMQGTT